MRVKNMLLRVMLAAAIVFYAQTQLFAQSVVLRETEVTEDNASVKILYATNRTVPVECYDLSVPPQIVVDFMGDIYYDGPEVKAINKGVVRQMRIVKGTKTSPDLGENFYPIDFIILDLKEPVRYDFDQGLTTSVLMIAKPGKKPPKAEAPKQPVTAKSPKPETAEPVQESMMPMKTEQDSASMSMEEKEYEQPAQLTKKTSRRAAKKTAAMQKKDTADPVERKSFIQNITGGIKNLFSFGRGPKTPEQIQAQKEKELRRQERIAEKKRKRAEAKRKRAEARKKRLAARKKKKSMKSDISKEPAKPALSKDPEKRVEQAKKRVADAKASVDEAREQLAAAKIKVTEAEKEKSSLSEKIQFSQAKVELAKDAYDTSLKHMKLAKSAANSIWLEYSSAKSKLSTLLEKQAEQAEIDKAQKAYDQKKIDLEKSIKAAEQAKKESDAKLEEYNSIKKESESISAKAADPESIVARAEKDYSSKENMLNEKQDILKAAEQELEDAEIALKKYKMEQAEMEYKKSLETIDVEITDKLEEERMAEEARQKQLAEKQRKLEENRRKKMAMDKKAEQERIAKEKEAAQLAALKALQTDQKRKEEEQKRPRSMRSSRPKMRKAQMPDKKIETKENGLRSDTLESAVELRNAGLEMQRKGDLDSAVKYYQQALMQDPKYTTVHNDLGILYEQKGLEDKAKMEYLSALKIDPQYYKAHSNLALLYEKSGDYKKAYYHWKQRVNLGREDDPWTEKAKQRMEMLEKRK